MFYTKARSSLWNGTTQRKTKVNLLITLINAFEKKCQKLPPAEKEKAEKCREDYENRVKGGTYYDNI